MTIRPGSRTVTAGILLIVLAVLLCSSLALAVMGDPMGGSAHAALFCCLIFAVTLTLIALAMPREAPVLGDPLEGIGLRDHRQYLIPARPPDRFELGALLI